MDLLGLHADDLQSNVSVSNGVIAGNLKYVTGYTGFSGKVEEQSGNYLALTFAKEGATTIKVKMSPSYSGNRWTTLESDGTNVFRVHDTSQKILVQVTEGTEVTSNEYSLSGLTLEAVPESNG